MDFSEFKLPGSKLNLLTDLVYKSKKPKQALKELEKWAKRDPDNVDLQAGFLPIMYGLELLRAIVLFECERYEESLIVCDRLAKQESRVIELPLLDRLQFLVSRLQKKGTTAKPTAGVDIVHLWQNALKSQSDGKDLLFHWYSVAVSCDHWEDVRTVTMPVDLRSIIEVDWLEVLSHLRKRFPNESKYFFHFVAATQIAADVLSEVDPTRSKLNNDLAFKFLEAGCRNSLATAQDLALLIYIYQRQGHSQELLPILESEQLGIRSDIASGDSQFVKAKISALEQEQMWPELVTFCESLLQEEILHTEGVQAEDSTLSKIGKVDWSVLAALVRALDHSKAESITKAEHLMRSIISTNSSEFSKRNALLALVALHDRQSKVTSTEVSSVSMERLVISTESPSSCSSEDACMEYYSHFGHQNWCYGDLRDYVENFTMEQQAAFMNAVRRLAEESAGETQPKPSEVKLHNLKSNALKFDYLFKVSLSDNEHPREEILRFFLGECLAFLQSAKKSQQGAVREVYFLAVMALMRLDSLEHSYLEEDSQNRGHMLHAAFLLSKYARSSPEDRQASLFLTGLYSRMGLGTLVLRQFDTLGIKEIMHDTQSHILYTRISITYPFSVHTPTPTTELEDPESLVDAEPYLRIESVLSRYKVLIKEVDEYLSNVKQLALHDRMASFRELKENYVRSFTKQMLVLERRRIARLSDRQVDRKDLDEVDFWLCGIRDNRDVTALPNYERSSARRSVERLWDGPKSRAFWLATLMLNEDTWSLLTTSPSFDNRDLETARQTVADAREDQLDELTDSEKFLNTGWDIFNPLVRRIMLGPKPADKNAISKSLQQLTAFLNETCARTCSRKAIAFVLPDRDDIQSMFLGLEFFKACSKFCGVIHSYLKQKSHVVKGMLGEDEISSVADAVQKGSEAISAHAGRWRTLLAEGGLDMWMECAVRDPIGSSVKEYVGTEHLELCIAECRDSALAALDGVLRVKML